MTVARVPSTSIDGQVPLPLSPSKLRMERLIPLLREYLGDYAENNHLLQAEEFNDKKLSLCILLALDMFNNTIMPRTSISLETFPSLDLMLEGAALDTLETRSSIMILESRYP